MSSYDLISSFSSIFIGNSESYGQFIPQDENENENEKKEGSYKTIKGLIDDSVIREHLLGKKGLGLIPILEDNSCIFTVIDVDIYDCKYNYSIIDVLYKYNFPLLPFCSKSNGLHLYLFFDNFINAQKAIDYSKKFIKILGLSEKTEIFPKQGMLTKSMTGSWINLPYFGGDEHRFLYDREKNNYTLIEAMEIIEESRVTEEQINFFIKNIPLGDAPPCLQKLYLYSDTEYRNNYLFSIAVYYKSKNGDNFDQDLVAVNSLLKNPISIEELTKTIISSHKRKSYTYKCTEKPLSDNCDKKLCQKREYGVGGANISELSFEDFIQYQTDPPYYGWTINQKELYFHSELDIISQTKFRELCFRELFILPLKLTEAKWTNIVNTALRNIIVKEIDLNNDISSGALFNEYLLEFFEKRAHAQSREQIIIDKVYKDFENKVYIYKPKNLYDFLVFQKQFKYFKKTEIRVRLQKMDSVNIRYFISKEIGTARVWVMPFKSLENLKDASLNKINIEYNPEDIYNEELY